ncbi:MAG TPA: uroporphyrinogen decarboxylase family protein [Planctomycetota bacterium]|jgi:uroporphyrinogen decarboxylase
MATSRSLSGFSPRERVSAAINHRSPDRTPRDFWAEPPAWKRLLEHFGTESKDHVLDSLGIDVRHLDAPGPAEVPIGEGVFQNFWGERYVYRQTPWGPMREDLPGALASAQDFADIERFPWPSPESINYSVLPAQCERLSRYALLYGFADVWQRPALVRGWENMFIDMVEQPEWVHFMSRKFTDFYKQDYTRAAEATKGRIDLFLIISDLGTQKGPLISVPMFREFVAPYIKELVDCIHDLGAKALYHSCGCIRSFIPELIALGVDILDPIQPTGPEMSPERLKADFGEKLCFHGGIDMQNLLPRGTPEEICAEVQRYCQTLGKGGGYILGPAHLFQPDVPPENIVAVYRG